MTRLIHRGFRTWAKRTQTRHPTYLEPGGPLEPAPGEGWVQAGPLRLHTLSWEGSGPPIVLVHGLNNSAWIWARVGAGLASASGLATTGRRVFAPTQRGHGASDKPGNFELEATSADLEAALDAWDLERVDLAGHSWGGKVVMHFAATRSQRVRSLVLADPAPPKGMPRYMAWRPVVRSAFRPERGPFPDRAALEAQMPNLLQHYVGDATDRACWDAVFCEQPDGSYRAALDDAGFHAIVKQAIQHDITELLRGLDCPVLLMLPKLSLTTSSRAWRVTRSWPRFEQRRMVGDHTFVHTNPQDTLAAMLPFLGRVEGS